MLNDGTNESGGFDANKDALNRGFIKLTNEMLTNALTRLRTTVAMGRTIHAIATDENNPVLSILDDYIADIDAILAKVKNNEQP